MTDSRPELRPEPRYYLVEHPDRYSWDYHRPGTPRPSGFTLWRATEAEIVALCKEFNARLEPPSDEPDTQTLDLFGGAERDGTIW